jgi:uncharacterized protein YmfQ (DUF2313 family)
MKYLSVLKKLLPTGPLWEIGKGELDENLLSACAQEFERLDERATQLYNEVFPNHSDECLSDWERVFEIIRAGGNSTRRRRIETFLQDEYSSSKASIIQYMAERMNAVLELEEQDPNAMTSDRASFTIHVKTPFARWDHDRNRAMWPNEASRREATIGTMQGHIERLLPAHIKTEWELI